MKVADDMKKAMTDCGRIDQGFTEQIQKTAVSSSDAAEERATSREQTCIALRLLDDNPDQPRQYVDPEYIEELAETILQRGLIHRIVVRRVGPRFQIVAGHCRRDAFKLLAERGAPGEWSTIPADIVE